MDIISAYREVGSYRAAAAISGTTPKTVRRVVQRHEADGARPVRAVRAKNYDGVVDGGPGEGRLDDGPDHR